MRLPLLTALVLSAAVILPQVEEETHHAQGPAPEPAPAIGKPAPAIRLNDHEGHATALGGAAESAESAGSAGSAGSTGSTGQPAGDWTVLAFYPKALTPG